MVETRTNEISWSIWISVFKEGAITSRTASFQIHSEWRMDDITWLLDIWQLWYLREFNHGLSKDNRGWIIEIWKYRNRENVWFQ